MNDVMQGQVFGGPLERLRQCAQIDAPKMADEFAGVRDGCENSRSADTVLERDGYFGAKDLKGPWTKLRDLMWTAAGQTGENLWALSQGLDTAVNQFSHEDTAAGKAMKALADPLATDHDPGNDAWKGGYDDGDYPGKPKK